MDGVRLGADVRLLRARRRWTQQRLASEARVSRWAVAQLEAGRAGSVRTDDLVRVIAALGGYLSVRVLYHGEGLDRLRDRRHAAIVDRMVARLRADGWQVATEVSFNSFGERGSIDILAFEPSSGALLVIEVKTVVPDLGGMLATLDRKVRLAREIAAARGWQARSVGRLLILPEASTARRRVETHAATFDNAFPARNVEVNRWLRAPSGPISGLLFLSSARDTGTGRGRDEGSGVASVRPRTNPNRRRGSFRQTTSSRTPDDKRSPAAGGTQI
jgi:transcriptional regulator with XRE-family HTH domain